MPDAITLVPAMKISASGLTAQSRRMEVVAGNVANAGATQGPDGKPFRRREVVFSAQLQNAMGRDGVRRQLAGVQIDRIALDSSPMPRVYKPGHPHADADGYVTMPNVNTVEEMVDMMSASRAYEANLAAMKTAKAMAQEALGMLK
jgi:flagellar basal-body rod protein FlgC